MQAVYIPEDDRCTDILGLVEDEDNLKYFISFSFVIKLIFGNLVFVRIH
jgi:hypothetical protein